MEYSKEHKIGKKKIIESDFSVKSVKTFMGREGYGVNANMYFKNKKIGHIIDSGNGGCLDIEYYVGNKWMRKNTDVDKFLSELPTYKSDGGLNGVRLRPEYSFDDEEMWNVLIDEYLVVKDFKKAMKKIQVLHKDKLFTFVKNNKPTFLDKKYRHNGENNVSFRTIIKDEYNGCVILNDIPTKEAISLFKKHCVK
tara:strand:+ start:457 stop:1041 length:585 start_codon:yes stop_codon:yes gene_type:complete